MSEKIPHHHSRWKRWLLEGVLFLGIFLGIQWWQTREVLRGPAPQFAGTLASGGETTFDAWRGLHSGRPVLLYFWADWCPICKTVAGSVDSIAGDWPVLTIAMQSGPADRVARTLGEQRRQWPTVVDEEGRIFASFGFRGVPAFAIVDAAGNIRFVETGYTSELGLRLRLWWVSTAAAGV